MTWRRTERFGHVEVFAAIAALSFLVARFVPVLAFPYSCPLKGIAGIPCATCGMTHAFVHLAHGDVALAFRASPLGAALAAGAWLFALSDAARVAFGAPLPVPSARALRTATAAAFAALPSARDRCSAPPSGQPGNSPAGTPAAIRRWPGPAPAAGSRSPTWPPADGPSTPSSATRRAAPGGPTTRPPTTPCGGPGCPG